jgi:hypothetical protein
VIDPEHLDDLKEMPVGFAARAAFGHAAEAAGLTADAFHPLHVEFYSLLVLTVGEKCTDRDVSQALHLAGDQIEGSDDSVMIAYADWFILKPTRETEGESEPTPIPVTAFVREAAAALAALNRFEPGERVFVGRDRATAVPAAVVSRGRSEHDWLVADESRGVTREVHFGEMWHAPLAEPTPLSRNDDSGSAV